MDIVYWQTRKASEIGNAWKCVTYCCASDEILVFAQGVFFRKVRAAQSSNSIYVIVKYSAKKLFAQRGMILRCNLGLSLVICRCILSCAVITKWRAQNKANLRGLKSSVGSQSFNRHWREGSAFAKGIGVKTVLPLISRTDVSLHTLWTNIWSVCCIIQSGNRLHRFCYLHSAIVGRVALRNNNNKFWISIWFICMS